MPEAFRDVAARAAARAGFPGFVPDACLVNRYDPGARLTLHQDRDERDFAAPIVSVSLGLPAMFLFGGERRAEAAPDRPGSRRRRRVGRPRAAALSRRRPARGGRHPLLGRHRVNLTLRKAR